MQVDAEIAFCDTSSFLNFRPVIFDIFDFTVYKQRYYKQHLGDPLKNI